MKLTTVSTTKIKSFWYAVITNLVRILSSVNKAHQLRVRGIKSQGYTNLKKGFIYLTRRLHRGWKIRLEWVVIAFLLAVVLSGTRANIIHESPLALKRPTILKTMPQTALATVAPLAAVQPPQPVVAAPAVESSVPAASTASAGCVSGYFTGDFYEDYIIRYESGGNSCATNYLGCFGLMQACSGEPLRLACGGDPACQLAWFWNNKVINDPKYGSWAAVYNHEITYGWW